jgi:hypothetical protein
MSDKCTDIKHQTIKVYGEGRYSSTILDFITRRRGVVSFMTQLLCLQGNRPQ